MPKAKPFLTTFVMDDYVRQCLADYRNEMGTQKGAEARARVVRIFLGTVERDPDRRKPEDVICEFYVGMIVKCGLSTLTARTYLGYVCSALRLRGPNVREAKKIAALRAARSGLLRPVVLVDDDEIFLGLMFLPAGAVRRTFAIVILTGARVADAEKLQEDEVIYQDGEEPELTVAWSQLKQRRSYTSRVTIQYPHGLNARYLRRLRHVMNEFNTVQGPPCAGVSSDMLNQALRDSQAFKPGVTSKTLRVNFAARVTSFLGDQALVPNAVSGLTGHMSDTFVKAVYGRNEALARGKHIRAQVAQREGA
ncbi:MAG: hypothetical protein Q9Q40_02640 [Acidobacteriota bacterium]|nr:hypothetical protein [Acidobacteriota bacterium]